MAGSACRVVRPVAAWARLLLLALAAGAWAAPAAALTSQTITFGALANKTYGAAPFTVNATASSGLAVSFASLTTTVCTVTGTTVTLIAAGTCTIQASQAGNATYAPAPNVSQSFTVAKATQTITFAALAGKTYGAAPFAVSATASSGLAVTFVSTTTAVCTVSGDTVTIVAGGTCTVQAQQAGNGNYSAAANINQSFTVAKASQTITFGALAGKTFGNPPFSVSATASSGLAVTFTSSTTSVCTVSGSTVTIVTGGTCSIKASQAGNADYLAATAVTQGFTVAKASQSITFAALPNQTYGVAPFTVSATASSGLAVTFTSTTTAVCTVSGSTVTIKAAGTCTIQAAQAGNSSYSAATSVSRSFTVAKANQTITFGALTGQTYGGAPFTLGATASSGLAITFTSTTTPVCTVSGSTVTIKAAGTCTIQAAQAGNGNYNAAPNVSQSFTVAKANQTITFGTLANKPFGSAPFTVSATASSGLAVTFSSLTTPVCTVSTATVTLIAAGTCTIQAAQAGNGNYNAAPSVSQSFSVAPASQTITFPTIAQQVVGVAAPALSATASSGLPVSFASLTSVVCTVSGTTLTLVAAGTCTVQASQAGNASYGAAPNVSQSFGVITAVQFAAQVTYPVGSFPFGVAVGDFNGDGKPDLAVVNDSDDTVSVFLGDGTGKLVAAGLLHTGTSPENIVVGDFNGDGKQDLAVANTFSQTVSVFLGNGDGTFAAPTTVAVGGTPFNLAVADLNGDGKLDLVVVNGTSGSTTGQTVEVLLGNGDGTFHAGVTYATGPGPVGVAIADFNGDGKLDLAVTNSGNNTVSILLGNGDGTFQAAVSYATPFWPEYVAVADLNRDGKADLVILNSRIGSFSIFLGKGDGTFAPRVDVTAGQAPQGLAIADLNGDGVLDLAIADSFGNDILVFLGVGDGTFHAPVLFATGTYPVGVAAVDLNKDGKIDLVVANEQSNTTSVLINTSNIDTAASVTAVTGTPQSAPVNTPYATALSVIVRDSGNNVLPGATVTFAAPTSGASGSFSGGGSTVQATTNTSGVATAPTFTANGINGSFTVLATAGVASAPFALTNTGSGNQAPAFTSGPAPGGTISSPYSFTLTASGTPAPTFSVTPSALPPGLGLNGTSGLINGTPTTTGTYAGMFTAANNVPPNATQTFAITIAGAAQTITFGALANKTYGMAPFAVSATASSGLTVSFASLTAPVCTVSGTTVTLVAAGTCTIQASQAGNSTYGPAPNVSQSFTVAKATQTITFGALANQALGTLPFNVSATASSGLAVSFSSLTTGTCTVSGATVTLVATGTCTIQAAQAGNGNYAAAPNVSQSFTITASLTSQTITFGTLANQTYGAAPFTVSATASSGLPVGFASLTTNVCTLSGATVTIVAVGTCTIQASQPGNSTYAAAPNVSQGFTVAQASQTITFGAPGNHVLGQSPFTLNATASSGLVVSYTSLTTAVCTVSGSLVTMVAVGTCTIQASQAGSTNYLAAPNVNQSFTVTADQGPTVALALPTNGSSYVAPATIPLWATASDASAPLTKVEFYNGSTLLGTATTAPYTYTWSNVGAGPYTLTAKAYDNASGTATSSAVSVTVNPTVTAVAFANAENVDAAVGYPTSVALGDFNRDGNLDAFVLGTGGEVFLGTGTGALNPGATMPNVEGSAVVTADFNGDGIPDLAIATGGTSLQVALGNGNGTFQAPVSYPIGNVSYGRTLVVGDFNGDGKLDIAVTNDADGTVSVLLGNGNGTFHPAVSYPAGARPTAIAAGDFNGDGKLDLVVTNPTGSPVTDRITLLLGNGDGTFRAPATTDPGTGVVYIAAGDFNGDGKLDLALTDLYGKVAILLGNGDGSFGPAFEYPTGSFPQGIVVADFNRDGKPDLAIANYGDNTVSILLGNGNGSFRAPVAYAVELGPQQLAVGDLNNDGLPDLVVQNVEGNGGSLNVSVLINTSGQTTQAPTFTSGEPPEGVAFVPYSFTFTALGVPAPVFAVSNETTEFDTEFTLSPSGALASVPSTGVQFHPAAGVYSVTVTASNGIAPAATQNFVIVIDRLLQTINFGPLIDQQLNPTCVLCAPSPLSATASSGLSVTFTSLTGSVCTIASDGTVTLNTVGTCTIRAEQGGDSDYAPAPSVDQSFQVVPAYSTVTITAPLAGADFVAPATIPVTATATLALAGGTLTQVQFFLDGVLFGTATSSPYAATATNVAAGTHTLLATSTEVINIPIPGAFITTNSAPVTVVVTSSLDAPQVTLTSPATNSHYFAPASISLAATASDALGSIARVNFYSGTLIVGSATTAPYAFSWSSVRAGTYTLSAQAVSATGVVAASAPVSVVVDAGVDTPIAAYNFDDAWTTAGFVQDIVGGYSGEVLGNVTAATASATGAKPDTCKAASFSGGTIDVDEISVATAPAAKTSVAFWMYWNGVDGVVPLSWSTEALMFSSGGFGFTTFSGDIYGIASGSLANGWHHVAAEFTNGAVTSNNLWIDGVPQMLTQRGSAPNEANAVVGASLRFGGQVGSTSYRFTGQVDEVMVFDGTFSLDHVNALYTAANPCALVNVLLAAPAPNTGYTAPATIVLVAGGMSQNSTFTNLQIDSGATSVGSTVQSRWGPGYTLTLDNVQPGTYTFTAKASDNSGHSVTSSPVTVTVSAVTGSATVSTAYPTAGLTFYAGDVVNLLANAVPAPSYSIAEVQFWANGQEIGYSTSAPYEFTWRNLAPGTYSIVVKVIDDGGFVTTSAPITITIVAGTPSVTYYYNDTSGTPIAATDQNGTFLWQETYAPYGSRYSNEDTGTQNGLWYAGKPVEDSTGLSYFGGRWYNPSMGRFYGTDPQRFKESSPITFNRYAYGNNSPYRYVDPNGRSPFDVLFLVYDVGKLGAAVYSGVGVGEAVFDVAFSTVGVIAPIPGLGEALKLARAARAVEESVVAVRVTGDALKALRSEFENVAKPSFWKREALQNSEKYSAQDLDRMVQGKAPIGSDGFPMELHHDVPLSKGGTNDPSNLQPMTRTNHRLGENYKINHPDD